MRPTMRCPVAPQGKATETPSRRVPIMVTEVIEGLFIQRVYSLTDNLWPDDTPPAAPPLR
jgi:hypothetical protein